MLVVGDDDVSNGTVGVNPRGGEVERGVPSTTFVDRLTAEVLARTQIVTPPCRPMLRRHGRHLRHCSWAP